MTKFLYDPGTNGLIASVLDLLSSELNSLASGGAATSSVGGTSGKFSQTNTANAIMGELYFTSGGSSFTPTAGGFLAGYFLRSFDGGTTFEDIIATASTSVPVLPRAPDFTIPLYEGGTAIGSGKVKFAQGTGRIVLPAVSFKVVLQNLCGAALPSSGNKITLGPTAIAY